MDYGILPDDTPLLWRGKAYRVGPMGMNSDKPFADVVPANPELAVTLHHRINTEPGGPTFILHDGYVTLAEAS